MSSDQTQQLSASKLEAACKQYENAMEQVLAKDTAPKPIFLKNISEQIKQHLLASRNGLITLPQSLQNKATQYLGEIAVMEHQTQPSALSSSPNVDRKTVYSLNAHLVRAFSNIPEAFYWMNEDGKIVDCNNAEAQLFGFNSPEEMIGKDIFDLGEMLGWDSSVSEKLRENDLEAFRTKQTVSVEEEHVSPSGEAKTFLSHKIPFFDKFGNPSGIMGMSIDISSIKNKEKEAAHQLRTVLANLPEAVYLIDKEGKGVICNEAEAKLFGLASPDDMLGKDIIELDKMLGLDVELAKKLKENDKRIMETGVAQSITEEHMTPDGKRRTFLSHKSPYKDSNNEIAGILGISIDITEINEAKKAAEIANQAKTEMLKNFRHELRTPLSGILGSIETIIEDIQELKNGKSVDLNQVEVMAKNSLESSNSLMWFVDDIIETVKVYDGDVTLASRKFSLKDQLNFVKKFNAPAAEQKSVELCCRYDEKIPNYFLGDDVILRKIIQELVVNAVKFTDIGQITTETKLLGMQGRTATIQFKVKDTGVGMDEQTQNKIFEFFHRGTPAYEGKYHGLGSGLFRTKAYVEKMGGDIIVKSASGQGTTVTCKIPFTIASNQDDYDVNWAPSNDKVNIDSTDKSAGLPGETEQTPTHRILLVEDEKKAALPTKAIISRLGCSVDVAETGTEAVNLATTKDYDLIYMDIGLPDISGIEATKKICHHQEKSHKKTPIVALTAHVADEQKQECLEAGMKAVYSKPLDRNMAETILNSFVSAPQKNNLNNENSLGFGLPSTEEALFKLDEYPLFDYDVATKICGDSREMAIEILEMFIDAWPDEKAQIEKAYAQSDWDTVQKLAHKAKGGALYCGITRMQMACQYMERYRLAGLDKQLEPLYQQLLSVADDTLAEISTWLAKHRDNAD